MNEIKHPVWGSNLANQLSAQKVYDKGEDGSGYRTQKVIGWFGREKLENVYVGSSHVPPTDNDSTTRYFQHRCGLLKIVMTPGRSGPCFVVFLDGQVTSDFVSSKMEFRFAPEELRMNEGKPIAEIWFFGYGQRYGPFQDYGTSRIICTFADKEQMDQYLDVTNRRMPKAISYKGVAYNATSSGTYQSSDGNILPTLLVTYFLLSPNEQQAFAAQNPEMQGMLGGGGEFGGAGATATFDTPEDSTPTDETCDEAGGQSDGNTDSGSSDLD